MHTSTDPLERQSFEAQRLFAEHPPTWRHPNKQAVFDRCTPPNAEHHGTIAYTRWPPMPWNAPPAARRDTVAIAQRPGFFDYAPLESAVPATE